MKSDTKKHFKKAFLNERFFLEHEEDWEKEDEENVSWASVILFYSAVHYVDALIIELGGYKKPEFHSDRRDEGIVIEKGRTTRATEELQTTNSNSESVVAGSDYKQLFDWAHTARYDPVMSNYFAKENLAKAKKYLQRIRLITCIRLGFQPAISEQSNIYFPVCSQKKLKKELTLCSQEF